MHPEHREVAGKFLVSVKSNFKSNVGEIGQQGSGHDESYCGVVMWFPLSIRSLFVVFVGVLRCHAIYSGRQPIAPFLSVYAGAFHTTNATSNSRAVVSFKARCCCGDPLSLNQHPVYTKRRRLCPWWLPPPLRNAQTRVCATSLPASAIRPNPGPSSGRGGALMDAIVFCCSGRIRQNANFGNMVFSKGFRR